MRLLDNALFGGGSLRRNQLRAMWQASLWVCPPIAVIVHLYWMSAHLNATMGSKDQEFVQWGVPEYLEEQAHFIQKVWHLMWTQRLILEQLSSGSLRTLALHVLRKTQSAH